MRQLKQIAERSGWEVVEVIEVRCRRVVAFPTRAIESISPRQISALHGGHARIGSPFVIPFDVTQISAPAAATAGWGPFAKAAGRWPIRAGDWDLALR
jgi:hypothetical protein